MAIWADDFSTRTTHDLELVITEVSTNTAANTSQVTATLQINPPSDSASWSLVSGDNSYSMTFEGDSYTGNFTFDYRTNRSTQTLRTVTKTVTHSANGTGTASASGSASTSVLGNASITTKTLTLTDFVRLPAAPSGAPTHVRSSPFTTIALTSQVATSPVSVTDYEYASSTDGTSFGSAVSMGTDRVADFVGTATQIYYFRTRAISSEGTGPWSSIGTSAGIPTAPSGISAVRSTNDVTVTVSSSNSNGGSAITGYGVQYSTDGTTWSTAQTIGGAGGSTVFNDLPPALTYTFRAYATNAVGNSAFATSAEVFIPAGGKRWDGLAWNSTTIGRRWTGTDWTNLTVARRWNGTDWADLS
jgi:hypothetical protein